jgi:hypothetical protein
VEGGDLRYCPESYLEEPVTFWIFPKIRGGIQNIPDWCRHLYNICGSANHRSQRAKLWIPGSTATFCGDCVKTYEDVAPNFGEYRPGCFTMTTPRLTPPSSPTSFWPNKNGCHPPPTVLPWFGTLRLIHFSKNQIEAERTPVWYHWGGPDRIALSAWHSDRNGLPGSVSKMEKTVG